MFIATSDIHLKHKLRMSREQVLEAAVKAVSFAKKHIDYIEFSAKTRRAATRIFSFRFSRKSFALGPKP